MLLQIEMLFSTHVCNIPFYGIGSTNLVGNQVFDVLQGLITVRSRRAEYSVGMRNVTSLMLCCAAKTIRKTVCSAEDSCIATEFILARHHTTMRVRCALSMRASSRAIIIEAFLHTAVWAMQTCPHSHDQTHSTFFTLWQSARCSLKSIFKCRIKFCK